MAHQFEIGDSVARKSGGPPMTVAGIDDDEIDCIWLDDSGQSQDGLFPADTLTLLEDPIVDMPSFE